MHVEVLFWDGCPSYPRALAELGRQMTALGLEPDEIELRQLSTDADAEREQFIGSPTIRIDGVDVIDPAGQRPALTCRIYRRRDGRISPTPDPADILDALRKAARQSAGGPDEARP